MSLAVSPISATVEDINVDTTAISSIVLRYYKLIKSFCTTPGAPGSALLLQSLDAPLSDEADCRLLLDKFNISGAWDIEALKNLASVRIDIEVLHPIKGDSALSVARNDIEGAKHCTKAFKIVMMPVLTENHREESIKLADAIIDEQVATIAAFA
ncbi:hypothetical protein H0H87_009087 [Tephrocybe sp. NHM501043]|nr:hypothetical protein H0H87_009087 [Tephrocybe sp. NHM501043]